MKRFAFYSDLLFAFLVGGLFSLVLFRFLGISLPFAVLLALVCGALVCGALASILLAKRKNLNLKRSDEAQKQKLLLHLALLSDEGKTLLLSNALSTNEPVKRFSRLRVFNKTEFFFLQFKFSPIAADEIPNLARLKTGKKKVLLCAQIEEAALDLCRRLDIEVRTGEWVYSLFKSQNALPERYLGEDSGIPKKHRVKAWFSRKNAKRFLGSGALILLLSRLTPFYYYYLLVGCCLLLVSVFVRIFGYA